MSIVSNKPKDRQLGTRSKPNEQELNQVQPDWEHYFPSILNEWLAFLSEKEKEKSGWLIVIKLVNYVEQTNIKVFYVFIHHHIKTQYIENCVTYTHCDIVNAIRNCNQKKINK